ncbi:MAG: type II toxin-antitoxin system VapC family toxin [Candidatus Rokubacteria bacterium]|nr:type II toxin-antitoxin system VapC family toxin [Candidatus Rokubacteria bacterium]
MVVLDSSFLVAYHNSRDAHHTAAATVMERIVTGELGSALLPEYVFLELVTVLLARRGLESASTAAATLLQAREVEFVPCSDFFLETFETFRTQRDGGLSFADAAIVTVARRRDARFVATFDRDFRSVRGLEIVPG